MDKELAVIRAALEAQGFTTRATAKGHLFVTLGSTPVTTFSGDQSDVRSRRNSLALVNGMAFNGRLGGD